MTDSEIIDLFLERSEQAIIEISKKHGQPVRSVAYNILGNLLCRRQPILHRRRTDHTLF